MSDFATATAVERIGDDEFRVELDADWTVGDKPHGGYLMAVLAKAASTQLDGRDPLALSAEFLRPPEIGEAVVETHVVKTGRTVSIVTVRLRQGGKDCVTGTVTLGTLPEAEPVWADLPDFPAEPEADAYDLGGNPETLSNLAKLTDLRVSRWNASIFAGQASGEPLRQRGWIRQPPELTDAFLALVAGDVMPPVTFNLGKVGWSPTVQLTALLRSRPAPGWLRIQTESRWVQDGWFDGDATVLDSQGRLVCQARQLALTSR